MSELGEATVKVVPDLTGFGEALAVAVAAAIEEVGEKDLKIKLDKANRPDLAKHIEVVRRRGEYSLKVDGVEFPWFITDDGVGVQVGSGTISSVTLTILATRVTVDDDWS